MMRVVMSYIAIAAVIAIVMSIPATYMLAAH